MKKLTKKDVKRMADELISPYEQQAKPNRGAADIAGQLAQRVREGVFKSRNK